MEKMIKIDGHVHSKGISGCSRVSCEEIVEEKIKLGYRGAILVNHCQSWYYPPEEHENYIERLIEEFRRGKAYADSRNFKWFLGIEVTLTDPHYSDWLLYGVTEEFLRNTPCLYQLSQKALFELCEENGILLVQAHPFRNGVGLPEYMHGVEINCTDGDLDKIPMVEEYAKEHGLLITCGTDYHFVERTYRGGMYIPEKCENAVDVAAYIHKNKGVKIFLENGEREYFVEK